MQYRQLGQTDIVVSELGVGCARLGGIFSGVARRDSISLLRDAFESGITFYDTADMYAQGESEALLGEALGACRGQVVIATKGGYCLPSQRRLMARVKPAVRPLLKRLGIRRSMMPARVTGTITQNFSSEYIIEAAHQSLKRLRTDYIDLYQLHSPPQGVLASGDFLEPLERLQREGKIRYYGVACDTVEDALLSLQYSGVAAVQASVNLLEIEALARLLPGVQRARKGLVARQCFASGLLARPPTDQEAFDALITDPAERPDKRRLVEAYAAVAADVGRSLPELALKFALVQQGVSTVLIGARIREHLASGLDYLHAAPLSPEELALVEWIRPRASSREP